MVLFDFKVKVVSTKGCGIYRKTCIVVVWNGVRPETELVEVMQDYIGGLVAELASTEEHDRRILLRDRGQRVRRRGIKITKMIG